MIVPTMSPLFWGHPRHYKYIDIHIVEGICVPNAVSLLAFHDPNALVKGLKEFPPELRPPVLPTFISFRLMAGLGTYFILAALAATILSRWGKIENQKLLLNLCLYSIPLPYLANFLGWTVAEVGRQPWIVYGVMKTSDGISKSVSLSQVIGSLVGFTLLYSFLGVIDIYLLAKFARKGPDNDLSTMLKPRGQEA